MRRPTAALIGFFVWIAPLSAQQLPPGDLTIVLPFGKGTTADVIGTAVADGLAKNLGRPVRLDFKPGAGGGIAMALVEKAKPDGLTLAMISQGTNVFNLSLYKTLTYDPVKIVPVTPIASVTNVMTVNPSNPANTPLEVVAAARAAPGKLTYASGGIGTSHHLSGVLFAALTGVEIKHEPFLISVDGIQKIVKGRATMGFFNLPTVINEIKAKRLKALAVTGLKRSPYLPDTPTLDESGIKGYDLVTWFGFGVPAGVPPDLVKRLRDEIAKVAADPAVKARLKEAGVDSVDQLEPTEFARFIAADVAKWGPIIKSTGVKAD